MRMKSELDQEWTLRGTIRLVSYVAAAVGSGFAWYGLIVLGKVVLRWLGVNV